MFYQLRCILASRHPIASWPRSRLKDSAAVPGSPAIPGRHTLGPFIGPFVRWLLTPSWILQRKQWEPSECD